jgi:hypothetical protein
VVFSIFLGFLFFNFYAGFYWKSESDHNDSKNNLENPRISLEEPNGKPLLVHQFANISNDYIERTLPVNVSFTLLEGWTSKNVTIRYHGVSQKKDWVYNGNWNFEGGWNYEEIDTYGKLTNGVYVDWDGNPNPSGLGCRRIDVAQGSYAEGDMAYYTQDIFIPESFSSKTASFSIDYKYSGSAEYPTNGSIYMAVIVDGVEKNKTLDLKDIAIDEWSNLKMLYNPVSYGQVLPGNITVKAGISISADCSKGGGGSDLYIDNVIFEPWTQPNENGLLKAFDLENNQNFTYNNITYGEGYSFIDFERTRAPTDQVIFTIYKNTSIPLDFSIDTITIYSSAIKVYNSSVSGLDGCMYTKGENIEWFFELSINIPFGYNSYIEIKKPLDWNVVEVTDGFEIDQTGNCLGKDIGSNNLIIPTSFLSSGLWQFRAISQNYLLNADLMVWETDQFLNGSNMNYNDIFIIDVNLNNSVDLSDTKINCTIFYSNNSIYLQDIVEPTSHNVTFGNYSVGRNMSVGQYRVEIIWINSQLDLEVDQIGFLELYFELYHQTSLTPIQDYFEVVSGEPVLIKVVFLDLDINDTIDFGLVTYNSTFGVSGSLTYQGLGQYFVDLDTSSLSLGDYYLSFNATKTYYEKQSIKDMIHIKIIAQSLVLEVSHTVINSLANDYAICQVNVTGSISGSLIHPVNLSTNWQNPYTIQDHGDGTHTLNFSTWDLPTQGTIETYTISIYANKTNYGMTTNFIALTIYPIQTEAGVNVTIENVDINNFADIRINYTIESSGNLILGANCTVSWEGEYSVINDSYGFVVRLNKVNLSINSYIAIIKLEKAGFATIYKTITIVINRMSISVNTIGFQDSFEASIGETIQLQVNLTDPYNGNNIENALIFYEWEFGTGYFEYIEDGIYELELKLPANIRGNHKMDLTISKDDSIYMTTEFSFIVIITEEYKTPSNTLFWLVIYGLLGIISIFGIISVRTYIVLPRKRRKESELLAKTQRYKDVMNIEAILISARESGLNIYSKNFFSLKKFQNELLSGFVQAITLLSNEIIGEESIEKFAIKTTEELKGIDKVIDLDFKHFNFFICDYKDIRIVFILKEKASEKLKAQTAELLSEIDSTFSNKLEKWDGGLDEFVRILPSLLDKHLSLYYREHFKLTSSKEINRIKREVDLNKLETRLLNVITSMTKDNKNFYLKDSIELIHEKKKDLVIRALEYFIENSIIFPSST